MGLIKEFVDSNGNEINLVRGDTKTLNITVKNNDVAVAIDNFNSVKFGIKEKVTDANFIISGTGTILDIGNEATRGKLQIILDLDDAGVDTALGTKTVLVAFLEITLVELGGEESTVAQYPIKIFADVNTN